MRYISLHYIPVEERRELPDPYVAMSAKEMIEDIETVQAGEGQK